MKAESVSEGWCTGFRGRSHSSAYLFDLGDVSDEGLVIDKLQDLFDVLEVGQEVVTDPLQEGNRTVNQSGRSEQTLTVTEPINEERE